MGYYKVMATKLRKNCVLDKCNGKGFTGPLTILIIPASVVHIGNRHKIGPSFMMSSKSTVVAMQDFFEI